jgi:hypothetical protein
MKIGRPPIWTIERLAQEARDLIEWASKEDSIVLAEFYGIKGYDYDDVHHFERISEEFAKAKRNAKIMIGARREKGALKGKLDSSIVKKSMALYDPEMKAYELEMKNASKQEETDIMKEALNAVREIHAARSATSETCRSSLETQQPVLDQGLAGKESPVSNELGSEGAL